nr:ribonuclease H-like domain-containing protein [Tanacetum cinerariifolium]
MSPEAPTLFMTEVPLSPAVFSPPSSHTRRKSLGRKHMHKPKSTLPKLDLDAPAQMFLKVVVKEDSDDEDSDDEVWSAIVGWEVLPTPLGEINALYRIDGSIKHFATLRQILYMVDRQDLMKLYGLVVQYYENHPVTGAGLLFWGDLQVLFDSQDGGKGSCVWQNQHLWEIRSWRLYTLSNVHVLETVSGEVLSMFMDVSYPLSVKLIERMLTHKLEIDSDIMGNDLTIAEQLIQFINNQLVAAHASSVLVVVLHNLIFSLRSDNDSDNASIHNEATNTQQQPSIQPQIINTVSNNNAKFPYLKKDEYEVWAMKMEYWITNNDMNIWKVIQHGNNMKRTGRDRDGRVIILPPTTAEEHIAIQRESKERTTLLQSILDDHVVDFHYIDDARDIRNAVKARWITQMVALTLKTKGGLELLSFDELYYKLKTLEVDVKGYTTFSSSQSNGPSHSAFVSTTSASKKMSYGDSLKQHLAYEDFEQIEKLDLEEMDLKWQMAMLSVRVHKFEQKARRKLDFDKKESARFNKKKVRCYKCQQRDHFARECRAKGGNDKQRYSSFKIKEIRKKEEDSKALITVDTLVDWTDHDDEGDEVITAKEFGMIVVCDSKDAIQEGAAKIYNLITGTDTEEATTADDARELALMGVTFETKLDTHLVQTEKWRNSSKNLFRLIDSSMSVRTKVGLGFNDYIRETELGWDDSAFSVFTTNSKDVEGRPIFHRFSKTDSMKALPPPLSGDYTSLSDQSNLDES